MPYVPGPYRTSSPTFIQPVVVTSMPASGVSTASMVFGILGVLGGWCLLGVPCVIAIICGHAGLAQTKDGSMSGRGQAVAGLIMGYVVVLPAILLFFLVVAGSIVGAATTPNP